MIANVSFCRYIFCWWAAGADIKEMRDKNFAEVYKSNFLGSWAKVTTLRKPIVGAVSGYAVSIAPACVYT